MDKERVLTVLTHKEERERTVILFFVKITILSLLFLVDTVPPTITRWSHGLENRVQVFLTF